MFCIALQTSTIYLPSEHVETMIHKDADKKAGDVAEKDVVVLDESVYVADAVRAMREKGVTSVLVSRANAKHPVGIITERDVLYRVVAEHRSPFKTAVKEVMSSPLVTVDESATVKDAILLMRNKDIRRMPVTRQGRIMGMLTLRSIVGSSREKSIDLAEVELPALEKVACPYCQSRFDNKQDLSKHIDRLHLGSGLLEGDLRQW